MRRRECPRTDGSRSSFKLNDSYAINTMITDTKKSNFENSITTTRAQEMLFECLKDELKELNDYQRSGGNMYLAWFTLHWTVNLGVLAACLSYYDRVQPLLNPLAAVFVFLNALSVVACFAVLRYVRHSEHRAVEILTYLNKQIGAADGAEPETLAIRLCSAYPYALGVRIMWLTQSSIWALILLWVLVLLRLRA
jgi:hypothetical protein